MSGYLKKTGGGGKESTGETESCMSLPTVLGDKFCPCDQSCDMVRHIRTKISHCDIKFYLFSLNNSHSPYINTAWAALCSYNRTRKFDIIALCFICSCSSPFCQNTVDKETEGKQVPTDP